MIVEPSIRNRTFVAMLAGYVFFIIGGLLIGGFLGLMIGITMVLFIVSLWVRSQIEKGRT